MAKNGSTSKWLLTPFKLLKSFFFYLKKLENLETKNNLWSLEKLLEHGILLTGENLTVLHFRLENTSFLEFILVWKLSEISMQDKNSKKVFQSS